MFQTLQFCKSVAWKLPSRFLPKPHSTEEELKDGPPVGFAMTTGEKPIRPEATGSLDPISLCDYSNLIEPWLTSTLHHEIRTDKTLQFWVNVACEHIKRHHPNFTKRQLVAQILREYERRGDAMRCLNREGKIAWKASPRFLSMLADAERDARDDLDDWP